MPDRQNSLVTNASEVTEYKKKIYTFHRPSNSEGKHQVFPLHKLRNIAVGK